MIAKTDLTKIYETILSIPGMNDTVKIPIQIPRKNFWLLSKIIERGLNVKDSTDTSGFLDMIPKEIIQEIHAVAADIIERAGLAAMNQKLQSI